MKFFIVLLTITFVNATNLEKIRAEYALLGVNPSHVNNLLDLCRTGEGALIKAYAAGAEMASAQYLSNPIQKLSAFRSGKNKLDALFRIPENHSLPELRFIRYSVQLKCPSLLGYTKNIEEDKAFLLKVMPELKKNDPALWKYILGFFLLHDTLSASEKKALGY